MYGRSPKIPFSFNLKRHSSSQTLMKALDILKPDWFGELRFLQIKNLNILLKISFSKILPQIVTKETG